MTLQLLLIALFVIILLLPYHWSHERTFGGTAGGWQSILYTYTYGPGYEYVEFDGMRRLQTWLLFIFTTVIGRLQPEVIIWLLDLLRRLLGL